MAPLSIYSTLDDQYRPETGTGRLALAVGILAVSTLASLVVLGILRRSLGSSVGQILPIHRYLGVATASFVAIHIVLVVGNDPTILTSGSSSFLAAASASAFLFVLIGLNRIQKRKYKLWLVLHRYLAMGVVVLVALHIYWLNDLIQNTEMRVTFLCLSGVVILAISYRLVWKPVGAYLSKPIIEPVKSKKLVKKARGRHRRRGMEYEISPSDLDYYVESIDTSRIGNKRFSTSQTENTQSYPPIRIFYDEPITEPLLRITRPQEPIEFSRFDDTLPIGRHRLTERTV